MNNLLKLRLLKCYNKLFYELVLIYFRTYLELLHKTFTRPLRHHIIHHFIITHVYAEHTCTLLYNNTCLC